MTFPLAINGDFVVLKRLVFCLAGVLSLLAASDTVYAGEKLMYQEVTDNKPDVGVSTTVYLGDRMLEQRHGQYKECIVPNFSHDAKKIGGWLLTIRQGEPICKNTIDADSYTPNYINGRSSAAEHIYDIKLKEDKDGTYKICLTSMGMNATCAKEKTSADFDAGPWFVYSKNSFQQTIEYSGRSGDILKFNYSEFTDNYARQAFTREFQVDLSQGNVAAYKGAVIEIESATNSSINYKVVRNFQQ